VLRYPSTALRCGSRTHSSHEECQRAGLIEVEPPAVLYACVIHIILPLQARAVGQREHNRLKVAGRCSRNSCHGRFILRQTISIDSVNYPPFGTRISNSCIHELRHVGRFTARRCTRVIEEITRLRRHHARDQGCGKHLWWHLPFLALSPPSALRYNAAQPQGLLAYCFRLTGMRPCRPEPAHDQQRKSLWEIEYADRG
jgi:hypothetical protein